MSKTPISILQELMVQRKKSLPDYVVENSDIPGVSFKCTVKVDQLVTCGYGPTKKDAKQNSAQKALELMGFSCQIQTQMAYLSTTNQINTIPHHKNMLFINYVGKLNEYASTHGQSYPTYRENVIPQNGLFLTVCSFLNYETEGYGIKKKDSKQDAAKKMMEKILSGDVILLTKQITQLHVDKLDNLNQEILKKYDNISNSVNKISSGITEIKSIPNLEKTVKSFEELNLELQKYGHKYTIETFQERPYIMMLKIAETNATLMGKGDTKEKALTDLYETAIHMFSHGFSLGF